MRNAASLIFGGKEFHSRLIVGTGKYPDFPTMQKALEASGAELVTVAVRRVNLDRTQESLLDHIDLKRYTLLPNTAGCYTAEEAIKYARLAREVGMSEMVKLEVIGDQRTLFPDNEELLRATRVLVKEGFIVLPYTNDDPVMAKKLEDAGVGTASDAAVAMELGCDGVLMNTGIAGAKDPVMMADAMRKAVEAGRQAYLAGRIPKKPYATASTTMEGMIE